MSATTTTLSLATGARIPQIGLGVWRAPQGAGTRDAVTAALELGYRHIDTARVYRNEADVGAAVNQSSVPRSEVFVTTKLWNDDQGYDSALRALDASLERLALEYVDLYLIHWPVPRKRRESWRAFAAGKARAIGVSNYLVPPHVNQIELTPFLQRKRTRALCAQRGIVVEAYSPLTRGARLDDPVLGAIARAVQRTPAQVLLRWGIQQGHVILPKSTRRHRIVENAALFDFALDAAQMRKLDGLEEGLATGWDPEGAP